MDDYTKAVFGFIFFFMDSQCGQVELVKQDHRPLAAPKTSKMRNVVIMEQGLLGHCGRSLHMET